MGAPPVRFDPHQLDSLQKWEYGLYGRNSRGLLRNQVEDTRISEKSANSIQAPKFLSQKSRDPTSAFENMSAPELETDQLPAAMAAAEIESLKSDAPSMYRVVEIKFSKFGVDDFDFA